MSSRSRANTPCASWPDVDSATVDGGAIYNTGNGSVFISNGTEIFSNSAQNGGGIWNDAGSGPAFVSIDSSEVYGNSASNNGGGIFNAGELVVTNSGIFGNTSVNEGGGLYNGALPYQPTPSATLTNDNINYNTAAYGGGVFNRGLFNLNMTGCFVVGNEASVLGRGVCYRGVIRISLVDNNFTDDQTIDRDR